MTRLLQVTLAVAGFVVLFGLALWLSLYEPLEDTESVLYSVTDQ